MEFGKTSSFKEIIYQLGADQLCFDFPYPDKSELFIGTPTWNQKEWVDVIYPKEVTPSQYLLYYAKNFNTIELNSTHYALPSVERVKEWVNMTPKSFHFSPKVPQKISHAGLLNQIELWNSFVSRMLSLEERLGLSFLQLSERFTLAYFPQLKAFLKFIPKDFPLAIEFRHGSFYTDQKLIPEVRDLLYQYRISTVITDTSGRRDIVHSTLTTKQAIVRFIGNNDEETDEKRLEDWSYKIKSWFEQGLERLYFFIHQPENAQALFTYNKWVSKVNQNLDLDLMEIRSQTKEFRNTQLQLL